MSAWLATACGRVRARIGPRGGQGFDRSERGRRIGAAGPGFRVLFPLDAPGVGQEGGCRTTVESIVLGSAPEQAEQATVRRSPPVQVPAQLENGEVSAVVAGEVVAQLGLEVWAKKRTYCPSSFAFGDGSTAPPGAARTRNAMQLKQGPRAWWRSATTRSTGPATVVDQGEKPCVLAVRAEAGTRVAVAASNDSAATI